MPSEEQLAARFGVAEDDLRRAEELIAENVPRTNAAQATVVPLDEAGGRAHQLIEVQEQNKENPDAFALLWEIKRLRALVLHADQLQRSLGALAAVPDWCGRH
jgi:hypothetical protein